MQGIFTYIPETNYIPREYSVAAILLLLFVVFTSLVSVLNLLYFYISTFRSVCVQCPKWLLYGVLYFMFSWHVAHLYSKWLWNSPSRPYYYWYQLCFYIPHALYFYCKVFFLNLLGFLFNKIYYYYYYYYYNCKQVYTYETCPKTAYKITKNHYEFYQRNKTKLVNMEQRAS